MPRPHTHADRARIDQIRSRARMLKDDVVINGDGNPLPSRDTLRSAAERLAYEDIDWLLNRIEENWE